MYSTVEMIPMKNFMFHVLAKVQLCKNFINYKPLLLSNAHYNRPCEKFKLKMYFSKQWDKHDIVCIWESSFSRPQVA